MMALVNPAVLGQGGFGITYLARDTQLGRFVAIKEYLPAALALREADTTVVPRSDDMAEEFLAGRERFIDEARTLARLGNVPSIVPVYDFLEANGTAYMVMGFAPGDTLSRRLRDGTPLSPADANRLLHALMDGLAQVDAAPRDLRQPPTQRLRAHAGRRLRAARRSSDSRLPDNVAPGARPRPWRATERAAAIDCRVADDARDDRGRSDGEDVSARNAEALRKKCQSAVCRRRGRDRAVARRRRIFLCDPQRSASRNSGRCCRDGRAREARRIEHGQ